MRILAVLLIAAAIAWVGRDYREVRRWDRGIETMIAVRDSMDIEIQEQGRLNLGFRHSLTQMSDSLKKHFREETDDRFREFNKRMANMESRRRHADRYLTQYEENRATAMERIAGPRGLIAGALALFGFVLLGLSFRR